jgi:hypothetical protein
LAVNPCRFARDQGRTFISSRIFAVTPLDLSGLIPYLGCAWATGLIWVAIALGRAAWHEKLSARSALVTAKRGASYACALSICAIATAAYVHHLISHGVEGLVIGILWAATACPALACDPAVELEFSGGDSSGSSDGGN